MKKEKMWIELSIILMLLQIPIQSYYGNMILVVGNGVTLIAVMIYYCAKYVIRKELVNNIDCATINIKGSKEVNIKDKIL